MPPTYLILLLVLEIILHFIFPIMRLYQTPLRYLGGLLIIIGGGLNLWGDRIFKKENTTIQPGEKSLKLVDYGPFKISRHPMYLGMFLILLGVAIINGSLVSFIFPVIFFIIIEKEFIPLEEKNMEKKFGKKYLKYKKKVRRWI